MEERWLNVGQYSQGQDISGVWSEKSEPRHCNCVIDSNLYHFLILYFGQKIENSKTSNKDSRLVWLGSSDFVLSSVFTPSFQREIQVWDVRNLTDPVHCSMLDTGNNVLTPLYDQDSSVLFLAGKAETTIRYCEVFLNDATNFVCSKSTASKLASLSKLTMI